MVLFVFVDWLFGNENGPYKKTWLKKLNFKETTLQSYVTYEMGKQAEKRQKFIAKCSKVGNCYGFCCDWLQRILMFRSKGLLSRFGLVIVPSRHRAMADYCSTVRWHNFQSKLTFITEWNLSWNRTLWRMAFARNVRILYDQSRQLPAYELFMVFNIVFVVAYI